MPSGSDKGLALPEMLAVRDDCSERRITLEASDVPDQNTLGSTSLFYSKNIGEPSQLVKTVFAVGVAAAGIPEHRVIREDMRGCAFVLARTPGSTAIRLVVRDSNGSTEARFVAVRTYAN
ncbi:hypothetical protein [Brachybacterium alimentarium]|uniref:hypothetical protein n=1 Tax=Brachybacterium alimentarium TaxID=47845 RepID=UPI0011C05F50|nr:hypothetical protein [Brachybacterium alimentarium]